MRAAGRPFTLDLAYQHLELAPPNPSPARPSLVLYGMMGIGKSGLAAAVANALMKKGKPVLYIAVRDVIGQIWDTYGSKDQRDLRGRRRSEIIHTLRSAPVLILDEMGGEHETNRDRRDIMEDILRPRCDAQRPVIITTNHTPATFASEWGGKTTDKLLERAHWIPMAGESLRQKWQPSEAV